MTWLEQKLRRLRCRLKGHPTTHLSAQWKHVHVGIWCYHAHWCYYCGHTAMLDCTCNLTTVDCMVPVGSW